MNVVKGLNFAGMTKDEKIKELAEAYKENPEEFDALIQGFELMVKALRTMKMPDEQIWAMLVVNSAEALNLDLDTPEGVGAAAALATFQVRVA